MMIPAARESLRSLAARRHMRRQASRLRHADHPAARRVASALTRAADRALDPAERLAVGRIESLRLASTHTAIGKTDHGAGPAGADRTADEMYLGVRSTTPSLMGIITSVPR